MATQGKLSAHISQATPTPLHGDDIEAMIARLDKKWRELKKLLRSHEDLPVENEPEHLVGPFDDDTSEPWLNSPLANTKGLFQVTAEEAGAIIKRVEKLDEETKLQKRLVKVQWQKRGLVIYSIICTIMFSYLYFSVFHSPNSFAWHKNRPEPAVKVVADAKTPPLSESTAVADKAPVPPVDGDALTSPPREANTPASPQENSGVAAAPKLPTVVSANNEPKVPEVEYVGSLTSNKYHCRSCKWAKQIGPRNVRVFHSVSEAQKAGYIQCPTCQPPLVDNPQTPSR